MTYLLLGIFGLLGVFARFGLGQLSTNATVFINLAGSFLIGVVYVLGIEKATISNELRVALSVGFLGGFTTFSAYSLETVRLLEAGRALAAAMYVSVSTGGGVAAAAAGLWLARRL